MGTPLILTTDIREQLVALREVAAAAPLNMTGLTERLAVPGIKAAHMAQMTRQSVEIPLAYLVTFTIEHNHPCGTCRHMSMSVQKPDRAPNEHALWLIALELGFWGSLAECSIWPEQLRGHGMAINVVQPVDKPNAN